MAPLTLPKPLRQRQKKLPLKRVAVVAARKGE
jgi:hypothetical protein